LDIIKSPDKSGNDLKIECDAQESFNNLGMESITEYAISDLRILKAGDDKTITKMYMFEETSTWMSYIAHEHMSMNRKVMSIHSAQDNLTDMGIKVLDSACWERMVTFFKSMKSVEEVDIMKNQKPVKIMARLNIVM